MLLLHFALIVAALIQASEGAEDSIKSTAPEEMMHKSSPTDISKIPTKVLEEKGITEEDLRFFQENESKWRNSSQSSLDDRRSKPTASAFTPDSSISKIMCKDFVQFQESYDSLHGYLSIGISFLGSIANTLNIIVLTRKDMNASPINRILTGMAVADILLLLEYIPFTVHRHLWTEGRSVEEQYSYAWSAYMWFHANFSVVIHNVSIWLTLTVAVWRFIMIRFHTTAPIYCTMQRCHLLLLLAYVVPVFLTIPNYISLSIKAKIVPNTTSSPHSTVNNITKFIITWSDLAEANDKLLYRMNTMLYSFILKLIPCIVLTVITGFLIHALYKAEERSARLRDGRRMSHPTTKSVRAKNTAGQDHQFVVNSVDAEHRAAQQPAVQQSSSRKVKPSGRKKSTDRTTRLLIVILLLFLLTEFPQGILGMLSTINDEFFFRCYSPLGNLMDDIALMNSSINFIIYCLMSKQFRKTFLETFGFSKNVRFQRVPAGLHQPERDEHHSMKNSQRKMLVKSRNASRNIRYNDKVQKPLCTTPIEAHADTAL